MATEQTTTRILDTAERLFLRKGPDSTPMREITDAAGVGLAAINYHFSSKENLIAEVATRLSAHLWATQEAALTELASSGSQPTTQAIFRAFFDPYRELVLHKDGRQKARLLMRLLDGPPSEARDRLIGALSPIQQLLLQLLKRANPELPAMETHFRLHAMVAIVLFYVQGGYSADISPTPTPLGWASDDQFIVEQFATMLDAPPTK